MKNQTLPVKTRIVFLITLLLRSDGQSPKPARGTDHCHQQRPTVARSTLRAALASASDGDHTINSPSLATITLTSGRPRSE